jgi:hypothetical protein
LLLDKNNYIHFDPSETPYFPPLSIVNIICAHLLGVLRIKIRVLGPLKRVDVKIFRFSKFAKASKNFVLFKTVKHLQILRIITSHGEGADSKSLQIKNIFFPNLSLLKKTKAMVTEILKKRRRVESTLYSMYEVSSSKTTIG